MLFCLLLSMATPASVSQAYRSSVQPSFKPSRIEVLAWCALAWIVVLAFATKTRVPSYGNDGYQYLSAADNINAGRGIETSIVYFDAERAHRTIPAPLTTFPPAYPALIAAGGWMGIPLETGAVAISLASFALLPLALAVTAPILGIRRWSFRAAMLLLVCGVPLLGLANAVATDMLFTAMVAGAIACFSRALGANDHTLRPQMAGWLLIGASYWIRYAGLFVFAAALVFFGLDVLRHRSRTAFLRLLTSIVALAIIGLEMGRNVLLTGSWKGGVAKQAASLGQLSPRPLSSALYHVLFGEPKPALNVAMLLLLMGVIGVLVLSIRDRARLRGLFGPALSMVCVIVAVYCMAMVYANLKMVISFGPRYFAPIVPPIFLIVACLLSATERDTPTSAAWLACVSLLLAGYLSLEFRTLRAFVPSTPHQEVWNAFHKRGADGDLYAWTASHIPPNEVITATNGQATAYALRHPVLCISDPPFTQIRWTRDELLAEMRQYHSNYLVLYPGLPPGEASVQEDSPFFRGMLSGSTPPEGLEIAARNRSVVIFRRAPGL
jgi:hypothetical protein